MMKKFNKNFEKKLEQEITAIEKTTSAAVVAAVTSDSDSCTDTYLMGGIIISFLMFLFLLNAPVHFSEIPVPVYISVFEKK